MSEGGHLLWPTCNKASPTTKRARSYAIFPSNFSSINRHALCIHSHSISTHKNSIPAYKTLFFLHRTIPYFFTTKRVCYLRFTRHFHCHLHPFSKVFFLSSLPANSVITQHSQPRESLFSNPLKDTHNCCIKA